MLKALNSPVKFGEAVVMSGCSANDMCWFCDTNDHCAACDTIDYCVWTDT
jgi:hypothetical protein